MKPWKILETTALGDHRVFTLRRERCESEASGRRHDFFVLGSGDWVNVVPVTDQGEIVLVSQYRAGTREIVLEVPGGLVDPGEDPAASAARELREETGYEARELIPLTRVRPNPAILDNTLHVFLAPGARRVGPPRPDGSEEIEVSLIPADEIEGLIQSGRIDHALVVVALTAWQRHCRRES